MPSHGNKVNAYDSQDYMLSTCTHALNFISEQSYIPALKHLGYSDYVLMVLVYRAFRHKPITVTWSKRARDGVNPSTLHCCYSSSIERCQRGNYTAYHTWVATKTWMWSTGEGNGKPLQYSCLENPMNSMKRQNDRILKEELPRSVGTQYATGDQWRNNSRRNEEMEPKQNQYPAVEVTGDRSKVRCCKEQHCIGTWNVRSMNQGKLEVVKRDGKSESQHSRNQWTKMDWNGWI